MQFSQNLVLLRENSKLHYVKYLKIYIIHLSKNFNKMAQKCEGQDYTNLLQRDLVSFTKYNVIVASHTTSPS